MAPLLAAHRVAFWMDRLLFPGVEKTPIRKPLFIVGVPRSGTTLMHRLVASNCSVFTTFPLWELLLAPALCEKYILQFCGRVDRWFGSPVARLIDWAEKRFSSAINDVHPTNLSAPEEDYLGLLPFRGCFLEVLLWPHSGRVWDLVAAPDLADPTRRKWLLKQYRGLLARHIRFRGDAFHVVSKNPSFTHWATDLAAEFPDAQFIGLRRDLTESLPSQLSSMRDGFRLFGHSATDPLIVERFCRLFESYWHSLDDSAAQLSPDRFRLVEYDALRQESLELVTSVLVEFGYPLSDSDRQELARLCEQARSYVSRHRYDLAEFGLTEERLRQASSSKMAGAETDGSDTRRNELAELSRS